MYDGGIKMRRNKTGVRFKTMSVWRRSMMSTVARECACGSLWRGRHLIWLTQGKRFASLRQSGREQIRELV